MHNVILVGWYHRYNSMQTVKEYLSDLLILTDEEQAFLSDFANKRYLPEKLFSDTDVLNRIRLHPMVEWKIQKSGVFYKK